MTNILINCDCVLHRPTYSNFELLRFVTGRQGPSDEWGALSIDLSPTGDLARYSSKSLNKPRLVLLKIAFAKLLFPSTWPSGTPPRETIYIYTCSRCFSSECS